MPQLIEMEKPGIFRVHVPDEQGYARVRMPEVIWRKNRLIKKGPAATTDEALQKWSVFFDYDLKKHHSTYRWTEEMGRLLGKASFDEGELECAVALESDRIDIAMILKNTSSEPWQDSYAEICVSFADSPGFTDVRRERTFGKMDGRWTALSSLKPTAPDPRRNVYHTVPKNDFLEECTYGWWSTVHDIQLESPVIMCENCSGNRVVAVKFSPCVGFCNNLTPSVACIHSDPHFGPIASGKTAKAHGTIYVFNGSKDNFLSVIGG